ncbi:MAG: 23S rRNA (guanosine(2251)-2'-O)-methyltransferase RlmB [Holosporales bacterium]|nr:23S rRNA (guanosine(2251)-2'-O)-methyltransferase RlmB [Holosporales bacterium]
MIIFGIHTCEEAFKSGKCGIRKVFLQNGRKIPPFLDGFCDFIRVDENEIGKMLPKGSVHQGIALDIDESKYFIDISYFKTTSENCCIAILDGVVDPHNFGAIIRTAAVFGVSCIITSEKSSCKLTGTVMKVSSGGIEYVSLCIVKNLSTAIKTLQEYGFWVISLAENGKQYLNELDLKGKICLVLGAEEGGIRRLQKEKSDYIAKLPTSSQFSTLNVSSAAAVAFYEKWRQGGIDN